MTEPFDPRAPIRRWTAYRKFMLVDAIKRGKIPSNEVQAIHGITPEELDEWTRSVTRAPSDLYVTRLSDARRARKAETK